MSCRAGVEEINSTKSKIKHMVTQGKNMSCMFEAQKLQMPQQSRWVPGHTALATGCLQIAYLLWSWSRGMLSQDGSGVEFSMELGK